jgi:hypothetical protein
LIALSFITSLAKVAAGESSDINFPLFMDIRLKLEAYAEGGMDILIEEVFGHRLDGNRLDTTYGEYEVDVLSYIYGDSIEVPF